MDLENRRDNDSYRFAAVNHRATASASYHIVVFSCCCCADLRHSFPADTNALPLRQLLQANLYYGMLQYCTLLYSRITIRLQTIEIRKYDG